MSEDSHLPGDLVELRQAFDTANTEIADLVKKTPDDPELRAE
ncbi:hypothetical protein ACFY4C_41320 [Actinomadura viridis]